MVEQETHNLLDAGSNPAGHNMRICLAHWDRLKKAIDDRGLGHLVGTSHDAHRKIVTELEGRGAENDLDPLLVCNNMIWAEGLKVCGLELMSPKEDGSERCPICEVMRHILDEWINGPADAVLKDAQEKGLV